MPKPHDHHHDHDHHHHHDHDHNHPPPSPGKHPKKKKEHPPKKHKDPKPKDHPEPPPPKKHEDPPKKQVKIDATPPPEHTHDHEHAEAPVPEPTGDSSPNSKAKRMSKIDKLRRLSRKKTSSESKLNAATNQLAQTSISDSSAAAAQLPAATLLTQQKLQHQSQSFRESSTSSIYGPSSGESFDDGINKRLLSITVHCGSLVDALTVVYYGGKERKHGGDGGDPYKLQMRGGEYVTKINLKTNKKAVVQIHFITNKGRHLGPCGSGKSALFQGLVESHSVEAPEGCMLAGFLGRASGSALDAIGFHWRSAPSA